MHRVCVVEPCEGAFWFLHGVVPGENVKIVLFLLSGLQHHRQLYRDAYAWHLTENISRKHPRTDLLPFR